MRSYLQAFRHSIKDELAYRFGVFVSFVTRILMFVVMYFLFRAYYQAQDFAVVNGASFNDIVHYLALTQVVASFYSIWVIMIIGEKVRQGTLAMELLRPYDFQGFYLALQGGQAVSRFIISGLPLFLFYSLFFGLAAGLTPAMALLFLLSGAFAFLCSFFLNFTIASLTFYTENFWGIMVTFNYLTWILSGGMIPLPIVPEPLRSILIHSPFAAITYTPVSIGIGLVQGEAVFNALALQLGWAAILFVLGRLIFSRALRSLTIQGG